MTLPAFTKWQNDIVCTHEKMRAEDYEKVVVVPFSSFIIALLLHYIKT